MSENKQQLNLSAIVVGQRRNNGEEWAYVMPTAAKTTAKIGAKTNGCENKVIRSNPSNNTFY